MPIANLLRDCLRELGSPTDSDDPSDMASEVFLVGVIAAVLETDEYTGCQCPASSDYGGSIALALSMPQRVSVAAAAARRRRPPGT